MIPKIIHYFWFGKKKKPKLFKKCLSSWKQFAPGFEIREWNENNFEFKDNVFYKEALENKKYAFCSDVARLLVLQKYGGIYLDIDVELIKPIECVLSYDFFAGRDERDIINTGEGFGCVPNHPYIKTMLLQYNSFVLENGSFDETPCPTKNEKSLSEIGFSSRDEIEMINNNIVFPKDYMCPICYEKNDNYFSNNTFSIHHYTGTWRTTRAKINFKLKKGEKLNPWESLIYLCQKINKKIKRR